MKRRAAWSLKAIVIGIGSAWVVVGFLWFAATGAFSGQRSTVPIVTPILRPVSILMMLVGAFVIAIGLLMARTSEPVVTRSGG